MENEKLRQRNLMAAFFPMYLKVSICENAAESSTSSEIPLFCSTDRHPAMQILKIPGTILTSADSPLHAYAQSFR